MHSYNFDILLRDGYHKKGLTVIHIAPCTHNVSGLLCTIHAQVNRMHEARSTTDK